MATVENLVDQVAYRINDTNFLSDSGITTYIIPFFNEFIQHAGYQLYWNRSALVRYSMSLSIVEDDEYVSLPTGFLGLDERPWLDGNTSLLKLLPSRERALYYTENGEPEYYEVGADYLYFWPHADGSYTIKGWYFKLPTALSAKTDTVPYKGFIDQLLKEYLVKVYHHSNTVRDEVGQFMLAVDPAMVSDFLAAVHLALYRRKGVLPSQVNISREFVV